MKKRGPSGSLIPLNGCKGTKIFANRQTFICFFHDMASNTVIGAFFLNVMGAVGFRDSSTTDEVSFVFLGVNSLRYSSGD